MKKIYVTLLILLTVIFAFVLSSCSCKHSFGEWQETKAPTCEKYGASQRVCTKCGEVDKKMLRPSTNHSFGEWETVSEPSCINIGKQARICTVCGKSDERGLPIDIEAHAFGEWQETKAPTDSEAGIKERTCTLCKTKETSFVPKLENSKN